jgi:hypothetical protein
MLYQMLVTFKLGIYKKMAYTTPSFMKLEICE